MDQRGNNERSRQGAERSSIVSSPALFFSTALSVSSYLQEYVACLPLCVSLFTHYLASRSIMPHHAAPHNTTQHTQHRATPRSTTQHHAASRITQHAASRSTTTPPHHRTSLSSRSSITSFTTVLLIRSPSSKLTHLFFFFCRKRSTKQTHTRSLLHHTIDISRAKRRKDVSNNNFLPLPSTSHLSLCPFTLPAPTPYSLPHPVFLFLPLRVVLTCRRTPF